MLDTVADIATGFSVIAGLVFLAKLWHQPRFVIGILPVRKSNVKKLASEIGHGTAQRTRYRQNLMLQPREYLRDTQSSIILPVLMQNQGHGMAGAVTVNIEFNTNKIDILDICTEVLKVNAIFGNAEHISEKHKSVVADSRIRNAYERIGPAGTYIQLVGAFPSVAVEIFALTIEAKEPVDIDVTLRVQTPNRIFQQKAVHQKLKIS